MTMITAGSTNVTLYVYFVDDDGGTAPGEPTTGKLFSNIETGGSASYVRQGAARSDFTLITLASASAAHADGGFILVDDTNMPGLYRVDVPDAAFAAGADFVIIQMVMAAANNSIMRPLLVMLPDVDFGDTVRAGLTALPNAAADAAGGLPISDLGALDLDAMNTNINDIETDTNELQTDDIPGTIAALNDIAAADVWAVDATTQQTQGTFGQAIGDPVADTTTIYQAVATDAAGDNVAIDVVAVKAETALIVADTNELQTDDVPGLIATLDAVVDTVKAETVLILADTADMQPKLGTPAADVSADIAAVKVDTAAILVDTAEIGAAGAGLTDITINAASVDAVWDELTTDHIAVNTFGQRLSVAETGTAAAATGTTITLDAGSSELADFYNGSIIVITAGTGAGQSRIISDYAVTTNVATVDTWITTPSTDSVYYIVPFGTIPGASAPTAGQVADAVWDEAQADHVAVGSFGITASEIATVEGLATGATGFAAIDTVVDTILVDTADMQPRVAAVEVDTGTTLQAELDAIQAAVITNAAGVDIAADIIALKAETVLIVADTNELQTDDIPGTIAALNDISTAQVNTEVLDVMNTDTITLPGQEAPPLTPTHRQAIAWLYKVFRNRKTQTATEWNLLADDETTVDAKATVSDDATTAIKQEIVSGP